MATSGDFEMAIDMGLTESRSNEMPTLTKEIPMLECESSRAGVTQLAECLLPKQNVAGSNPVSRSTSPL